MAAGLVEEDVDAELCLENIRSWREELLGDRESMGASVIQEVVRKKEECELLSADRESELREQAASAACA